MGNRYPIVGTQFTGVPESFVAALKPGTPATLVREPQNIHDRNAIAVYVEGQRIGFIKRTQNVVLAQFIDQSGRSLGEGESKMALDAANPAGTKAIDATFIRSPNSGFPMVEV